MPSERADHHWTTANLGDFLASQFGVFGPIPFAVLLIDISMFLAYRRGTAILTNTYTSVGGIILFALLSLIVFHESLTVMKGAGIALGAVSLILIAI